MNKSKALIKMQGDRHLPRALVCIQSANYYGKLVPDTRQRKLFTDIHLHISHVS